jgi:hypothetical protein
MLLVEGVRGTAGNIFRVMAGEVGERRAQWSAMCGRGDERQRRGRTREREGGCGKKRECVCVCVFRCLFVFCLKGETVYE